MTTATATRVIDDVHKAPGRADMDLVFTPDELLLLHMRLTQTGHPSDQAMLAVDEHALADKVWEAMKQARAITAGHRAYVQQLWAEDAARG